MASDEKNRLYGTSEATEEKKLLTRGAVSCELLGGALRHISHGGFEAIRRISLTVRDTDWGTCSPQVSGESLEETDGQIVYSRRGEIRHGEGGLRFSVDYRVQPDEVIATAAIAGLSPFDTNRAGFDVLHPLDGLVGSPVTVIHADGTEERSRFPQYISPSQPLFSIRTLIYKLPGGTTVHCTMTGDEYEMEDQRNWTDASYKTYIRPLSKPRPYRIAAGEVLRQEIRLQFLNVPKSAKRRAYAISPGKAKISVGSKQRSIVPALGVGCFPGRIANVDTQRHLLQQLHPQYLELTVDLREDVAVQIKTARTVIHQARVPLWLRAVVPDSSPEAIHLSLKQLAASLEQHDLGLEGITALPAAYLKSYQPAEAWPQGPGPEDAINACRTVFKDARIGGGMLTYFTELNRCRPPATGIDFITHSTAAIVHSADDRSVMQTLEALPHVFASGRQIARGRPYRLGASSIAMWTNPYGVGLVPNDERRRVMMTDCDPRQTALFGAAWTVGYFAAACAGGVEALALSTLDWPFPVSDPRGFPAPVFHVIKGLSAANGSTLRQIDTSDDSSVACVAWQRADGVELWLANLKPEAREIELEGCVLTQIARLNSAALEQARSDPAFMHSLRGVEAPTRLSLGAFEVVRALGTAPNND